MTTPAQNSVQPPRPPRWRFFFQYSLRTLLLVTTVAAVGCWWLLRPRVLDEQLAGKFLQLRRQVRVARFPPREFGQSSPDFVQYINVGRWQLRDDAGNLLVAGRYDRELPEGWWTTYHANGRKAVQGKVLHGAKVGLWRVWDDTGRLTSELTYGTDSTRHGPARVWYPSGQLKFEGAYKDDRRDGAWTFYDEQGRVMEKREYE